MKELYDQLSLYLHPASLVVAIAFDLLWSLPEGLLTASWVGIVLLPLAMAIIFFACALAVTGIQYYLGTDSFSSALKKGLLLGLLAALPYSFVGLAATAFWGFMRLVYGVDQEVILLGKLARSWRDIERVLRRMAPEMQHCSLEDVINNLYNRHLLSGTLREELHQMRQQRNINMHQMSTAELETLVDQVQAVENRLHTRFLAF